MSNDYYNHDSDAPANNAQLSSSQIRAELDLIAAGFDELPTPTQLAAGSVNSATTTGSANAYLATIASVTAYADKQRYTLKINVANTDASTVNISGLGARTIKRPDGADIEAGDLATNGIYDFVYNSTTATITLMNLMPTTVQSMTPEFTSVDAEEMSANGYEVTIVPVNLVAGVATIDWSLGSVFEINVTSDFTVTFTNFPTTAGRGIRLIYSNTGAYNVTGMTASGMTVKRPSDVTLTLTSGAGKIDQHEVMVYRSDTILVTPMKNYVNIS